MTVAWRQARRLAALCGCLVLAGCVSVPERTPAATLSGPAHADALAAQAAREQALAATPDWTLEGRVAIARGKDGGSGRIEWRQQGDRYAVSLGAPVTRQSWRLSGDAAGARLEGIEGGPREGPDASLLLLEATRLEVPVAALASWVRGARADTGRFGPAEAGFDAGGRLVRLVQGGWTIDYLAWAPPAGDAPALPSRLAAERGDARVRLVIDAWGVAPAP
jgi:outer membrane lipoprotein LolB